MYYNNTISTYNNIYGKGSISICVPLFKIFLISPLISVVFEIKSLIKKDLRNAYNMDKMAQLMLYGENIYRKQDVMPLLLIQPFMGFRLAVKASQEQADNYTHAYRCKEDCVAKVAKSKYERRYTHGSDSKDWCVSD